MVEMRFGHVFRYMQIADQTKLCNEKLFHVF